MKKKIQEIISTLLWDTFYEEKNTRDNYYTIVGYFLWRKKTRDFFFKFSRQNYSDDIIY